jgi:glutamyl-tRNA synthetase
MSTTSCSGVATICRPTTSRWWSTTPTRRFATARQVLLARLLALPVPRYAHVPLVLGPDGRRLAKRHGAVTLAERLAGGERVEQVIGWLAASCGLAPNGACLRPAELLEDFDPARIGTAPTRFAEGTAPASEPDPAA